MLPVLIWLLVGSKSDNPHTCRKFKLCICVVAPSWFYMPCCPHIWWKTKSWFICCIYASIDCRLKELKLIPSHDQKWSCSQMYNFTVCNILYSTLTTLVIYITELKLISITSLFIVNSEFLQQIYLWYLFFRELLPIYFICVTESSSLILMIIWNLNWPTTTNIVYLALNQLKLAMLLSSVHKSY